LPFRPASCIRTNGIAATETSSGIELPGHTASSAEASAQPSDRQPSDRTTARIERRSGLPLS
jgi:hypothetical protein